MRTQIIATVLLACCVGGASAADWSVDPKVTLQAQSDDNNRMTDVPGEEISVAGAELDAELAMRAETPRSSFRFIPRFRATIYPGEEDDESEDAFLRMDWEYRGERSEAVLDVNYAHRTILGRYFPESPTPTDGGLGQPGQGSGSGRTTFPTDQDALEIQPSVTFDLTERTSMFARLGYQDVKFDDQVVNDRENFTDAEGEVGVQFRTSPTATLGFSMGASRYEPENNFDSDSQFMNVEWSNDISEVSRVYLRGGANRVKPDDGTNADWETGFVGGAGVQWAFEVTDLFLEYNHYVDPNPSGRLVNRDHLRFQLSRRFSERTRLNFAARAIRDADTGNDETFQTREFIAASVDYEWRFTQQFSLVAGYEYAWREYEDEPNSAESNRLFLGVTYEPHRR